MISSDKFFEYAKCSVLHVGGTIQHEGPEPSERVIMQFKYFWIFFYFTKEFVIVEWWGSHGAMTLWWKDVYRRATVSYEQLMQECEL